MKVRALSVLYDRTHGELHGRSKCLVGYTRYTLGVRKPRDIEIEARTAIRGREA